MYQKFICHRDTEAQRENRAFCKSSENWDRDIGRMAVSVYATRCDAHVNRLDICGPFAETPQHHLFFDVNGEKYQ